MEKVGIRKSEHENEKSQQAKKSGIGVNLPNPRLQFDVI